jgi:hypothetical protein
MESTWDRVDDRVLRWVATLPPAFTNQEIVELSVRPPRPFDPIPGLDTQEVGESLRRLGDAGLVSGKTEYGDWWELRLAPRGLIYLGEWPDVDLVASTVALHRLLNAAAEDALPEERDALRRAAGVVSRTMGDVLRDTLGEVAHRGGEEIAG